MTSENMVDDILTRQPRNLWPVIKKIACVSKEQFDRYYEGCLTGVAIFVSMVRTIEEPLTLGRIREIWPRFRPPQGFQYLESMNDRMKTFLSPLTR